MTSRQEFMAILSMYTKSLHYADLTIEEVAKIVEDVSCYSTAYIYNHPENKGFVIVDPEDNVLSIYLVHIKPEYLYSEPVQVLNTIFMALYNDFNSVGWRFRSSGSIGLACAQISHLNLSVTNNILWTVELKKEYTEEVSTQKQKESGLQQCMANAIAIEQEKKEERLRNKKRVSDVKLVADTHGFTLVCVCGESIELVERELEDHFADKIHTEYEKKRVLEKRLRDEEMKAIKETKPDFYDMNFACLINYCKERQYKGFSKYKNRSELIQFITNEEEKKRVTELKLAEEKIRDEKRLLGVKLELVNGYVELVCGCGHKDYSANLFPLHFNEEMHMEYEKKRILDVQLEDDPPSYSESKRIKHDA